MAGARISLRGMHLMLLVASSVGWHGVPTTFKHVSSSPMTPAPVDAHRKHSAYDDRYAFTCPSIAVPDAALEVQTHGSDVYVRQCPQGQVVPVPSCHTQQLVSRHSAHTPNQHSLRLRGGVEEEEAALKEDERSDESEEGWDPKIPQTDAAKEAWAETRY